MKKSLTIPETAALLNVSRRQIYHLLRRQVIFGTGRRRILWESLEKVCILSGACLPDAENGRKMRDMSIPQESAKKVINGEDRLLRLSQVAKILNVSRSTAYEMFTRGDLRGVRVRGVSVASGTNLLRVFESSVLELLVGKTEE